MRYLLFFPTALSDVEIQVPRKNVFIHLYSELFILLLVPLRPNYSVLIHFNIGSLN